jgi:hypothetical protein
MDERYAAWLQICLTCALLLGCEQSRERQAMPAAPPKSSATRDPFIHSAKNLEFLTIVSAPSASSVAPRCDKAALEVKLEINGQVASCRSFLDAGAAGLERLFCNEPDLAPNRSYRLAVLYRLRQAGQTVTVAKGRLSNEELQLHAGINPFEIARPSVDTGLDDDHDGVSNLEEACPSKTAAHE